MTPQQALADLNRLGTEQNRKVYARHGVGENMFGVSFANMKALAKKIGKDQDLAVALWDTGNHDARILATSIADPVQCTRGLLNIWVKQLKNYVITDAFTLLVSKTSMVQKKADEWSKSKQEFPSAAGWTLVTHLAQRPGGPDDAYFLEKLALIESGVHERPNRTRYSMVGALIGIGIRSASLRKRAEAVAKAIGPVEVDHGETGCKTPDPIPYIANAWKRKESKKAAPRKATGSKSKAG